MVKHDKKYVVNNNIYRMKISGYADDDQTQKNVNGSMYLTIVLVSLKNEMAPPR
jgi:hypothetical protein